MSLNKMSSKLKTLFILLWILFIYIAHYYFEIKKYLAYVPEHLPFLF